jgi:pimeloyl-ACP methyl ester carboxylesterase
MMEAIACEHAAGTTCAATAPVSIAETLRRFEREATRGVCDTGRYRCPYYVWGQGPPLVFIHGLGDTCRSFLAPIASLSAHFRCIAFDLPTGRGDRARPREYRHADLVSDLFALLDHLQLKQSYVLGSSFGSTIALAAAHLQPRRLPRLILQGGFARRPLLPAELLVARVSRYLPGTMRHLPFRERILQRSHYEPFAGRVPEMWQTFLDWSGETPIAAAAWQALILHRVDIRRILADIRQPVLLVCGDRDPLIHADHEEVLLNGLPNAGRFVIPGAGHMPSYSHPEMLALIVRDFLTPPE